MSYTSQGPSMNSKKPISNFEEDWWLTANFTRPNLKGLGGLTEVIPHPLLFEPGGAATSAARWGSNFSPIPTTNSRSESRSGFATIWRPIPICGRWGLRDPATSSPPPPPAPTMPHRQPIPRLQHDPPKLLEIQNWMAAWVAWLGRTQSEPPDLGFPHLASPPSRLRRRFQNPDLYRPFLSISL